MRYRATTTFSFEERVTIEHMLKKGVPVKEIVVTLNRSSSGTYNEIERGGGRYKYSAKKAQKISDSKPLLEDTFTLRNRMDAIEMQIEIILDILKDKL